MKLGGYWALAFCWLLLTFCWLFAFYSKFDILSRNLQPYLAGSVCADLWSKQMGGWSSMLHYTLYTGQVRPSVDCRLDDTTFAAGTFSFKAQYIFGKQVLVRSWLWKIYLSITIIPSILPIPWCYLSINPITTLIEQTKNRAHPDSAQRSVEFLSTKLTKPSYILRFKDL